MTIRNNLRLSHDSTTDRITLRIRGGTNRRTRHPLSWVDRADLRELCDMLHDYADQLDREDREQQPAAPPDRPKRRRRGGRGRGVQIATTAATEASTGSDLSPSGGGTPSRAHARARQANGGADR